MHAALVPGHAATQPRLAAAFVTAAVAAVGAAAALAAGRGGADVLGPATTAVETVGLWGAIVTVSARSGPVPLLDSAG